MHVKIDDGCIFEGFDKGYRYGYQDSQCPKQDVQVESCTTRNAQWRMRANMCGNTDSSFLAHGVVDIQSQIRLLNFSTHT